MVTLDHLGISTPKEMSLSSNHYRMFTPFYDALKTMGNPMVTNRHHIDTSGNKTDVVKGFVNAFERRGVLPGFYYCSWGNHNKFGSQTCSDTATKERSLLRGADGITLPTFNLEIHPNKA